jgi:MFS family permease
MSDPLFDGRLGSESITTARMALPDITQRTFRTENLRSLPAGILETLTTTFGMLIAVRVFDLGSLAKSVFLSSTAGGLMISLVVVPVLLRMRSTLSSTASRVQFIGSAFFALAALFPSSPVCFIGGLSVGLFSFSMQIPLMTQIYRINYPQHLRGRLYSISTIVRSLAAMSFGFAGGLVLGWDVANYTWLLWAFAVSGMVSAFWTRGLPAVDWTPPEERHKGLWSSWRWVAIDRDFRLMLASWMLNGLGTLVAVALFVEYLANPVHGINLSEKTVAWTVGVVPVLMKMIFAYPWGLVYDRVNFFTVRASLNVVFAIAILVFYLGHGIGAWTAAMALFGFATAGGNVAWSLWVTKLAPKHAVAEYMSVHTFLTGVRGLIAPFLAFALVKHLSFESIGIGCAVALLCASGFITARARAEDSDPEGRLGAAPERI